MMRFLLLIIAMLFAGPLNAAPAWSPKAGSVRMKVQDYKSRWFVDTRTGGWKVDGFDLRMVRGSFRINGDASDIAIRNGTCTIRGVREGSDLPVCIDIQSGHDILVENVTASNHRMVAVKGKYTNGDGFSQEGLVYNVTYRHAVSRGNSDGGFDLKGKARLIDTVAERNGRNYRFWGSIEAGTITSVDPRGAHIWIDEKAKSITIEKLIARSTTTAPIVQFDAKNRGIEVTIKACELSVPPGTEMVIGKTGNKVTLGAGCRL